MSIKERRPIARLQPSSHCPASRFDDEFRVIERLGRGGFGSVFKVRNTLDGKLYAIKRIRFRHREHVRQKLVREVQALASLSHPNIVRYHSAWIEQGSAPCSPVTPFGALNSLLALDSSAALPSADEDTDAETIDGCASGSEGDSDHSDTEGGSDEEDEEGESSSGLQFCLEDDESKISPPEPPKRPQRCAAPRIHAISTLYIQMQLCEDNLQNYLQNPGRTVNHREAMSIFRQIVQALEYIHSSGVIHRDLKPANVFLTKRTQQSRRGSDSDFEVCLGDFGLATFVQAPPGIPSIPASPRVTIGSPPSRGYLEAGGVPFPQNSYDYSNALIARSYEPSAHTTGIGTTTYASPEQIAKHTVYNEKTDIFSLGILLFELLSPPFKTGMERARYLSDLRKGVIPRSFSATFSRESVMIQKCVSMNPEQRPSAAELREDAISIMECSLLMLPGLSPRPLSSSDESHSPPSGVVSADVYQTVVVALRQKNDEVEELKDRVKTLQLALKERPPSPSSVSTGQSAAFPGAVFRGDPGDHRVPNLRISSAVEADEAL